MALTENQITLQVVSDGQAGAQGPAGPQGPAGADGQDGADGYSPTASVTKSGDTATITITDKTGTTTQTVSDGADGQDGAQGPQGPTGPAGQDGEDGKSAYEAAIEGGLPSTVTENQFNTDLGDVPETKQLAEDTHAHFYHDSNGAHVLGDTYRTDVKDGLKVVKNLSGQVLADFAVGGATIKSGDGTQIAHLGYDYAKDDQGGTTNKYPYYDLGIRTANSTIGAYSMAEGGETVASGAYSHAEGFGAFATGACSHAEGTVTTANGDFSHAEGGFARADGLYSHAEGYHTIASGNESHAEGLWTEANGDYSHAEGANPEANGDCSHAEGFETIADGHYSHAEGFGTIASSNSQHVQGINNVAMSSFYADVVGNGRSDTARSNAYALKWDGNGYYYGDVYVGCNNDSTGGSKLALDSDLTALDTSKQDTLVSGTNIKTVNNQSLLGSGNITIQGGEPSAITDERIEEICSEGDDGFTLTVSSSSYGTWTITYADGTSETKSDANFAGTYSNVVSFGATPFAGAAYDKAYTYDVTAWGTTSTVTESQHVFMQTATITLPSDMTITNTWDDD